MSPQRFYNGKWVEEDYNCKMYWHQIVLILFIYDNITTIDVRNEKGNYGDTTVPD